MRYLLVNLLLCSVTCAAAPATPQWTIVKTRFPTPDVVVAGYNVLDFGTGRTVKPIAPLPFSKRWMQWLPPVAVRYSFRRAGMPFAVRWRFLRR